MRVRAFMAIVAVLVLGWPGVAHAKGPAEATIEGDSLEAPVFISAGSDGEGGDGDFWKLVEQSGFFDTTFGQSPDRTLKAAPTDQLGPSFVVTWQVPYASETGVERVDPIRMTLYPYADGGPLSYTEPGQPFFEETSQGGWFRMSKGTPAILERLGVPAPKGFSSGAASSPPTTTKPASASAAAATPASASSDDGATLWPEAGIVAIVAAAATGGALLFARRRVRVSPA